jgi:monofunctional biosynthetic peptidoglycan transglycosylase
MGKIVATALLALLATPLVVWVSLPWPVQYRWTEPAATAVMRYRVEQARDQGEALALRQDWVPLSQISTQMVRAVLASEDGRFREHNGIDWIALGEELRYRGEEPFSVTDKADLLALAGAGRYYLAHRSEVKGRSTITQQLAKNLYFTPERSLARKAAEFVVARRLEKFLGKDRILEVYLNTAEFGPGLFGVEAAAQEYFELPASRLTTFQAASLAATLPHPLTSNPKYRPSRMAWRRDLILRRLRGEDSGLSAIPEQPAPLELPGEPGAEAEPGAETPSGAEPTGAEPPTGGAAAPATDSAAATGDPGGGEPPSEPTPEPSAAPPEAAPPAPTPPAVDTVTAAATVAR